MSVFPLEPFEAAMPAALRSLLVEARKGNGPLAWLFDEDKRRSGGNSQSLMRGYPPMPPEVVGWAVGICFFDDHSASYLFGIMTMYAVRPPVPFVLEAIGAGLSAGLELPLDSWKRLEPMIRFAELAEVPDVLLRALPIGLMSNSATLRTAALSVARREPKRIVPILEATRLRKLPAPQAKRLDDALSTFAPKSEEAPAAQSSAAPTDDPLARLLAAWAVSFDPRLIPAITALGAAEATRRGPLKAASKGELESAWHVLAARKDPGDVDRLLSIPWPGAWKLAVKRVNALEPFPADPRIAAAVALHAPRYTSWPGRAVQQAASRVSIRMQQLKKQDAPEAILREAAKFTPVAVDLTQLWKAVWDAPQDDGARAVLADALQHAGDPRGEFITLQLAISDGRADAAAVKRANELLKQHIDSWSGSLPAVQLASREFRRGFLSAVFINGQHDRLKGTLDRLEWRTLERLSVQWANVADLHALLERMPCLRVLLFQYGREARELAERKGSVSNVTVLGVDDWFPIGPLPFFPRLEMLYLWSKVPLEGLHIAHRMGLKRVALRNPEVAEALKAFESPQVRDVNELIIAMDRGWSIRVTRNAPEEAELFLVGRDDGNFAEKARLLGRKKLHVHCPANLAKKLNHEGSELTFHHRPFDILLLPRK